MATTLRTLILLVVIAGLAPCAAHGQDAPQLRAQIEAAWKARQASIQNARMQWRELHFWPQFSLVEPGRTLPLGITAFPEQDLAWALDASYVVDGAKFRGEQSGKRPQPGRADLQPTHQVMVFDGKDTATVNLDGATVGHPNGVVQDDGQPLEMSFNPMRWAMRPLDSSLLQEFLASPELEIDTAGDQIHVAWHGRVRREMWLDPAKAYVVTRFVSYGRTGEVGYQIEITYDHSVQDQWQPALWKIEQKGAAGKQRSMTGTRTALSINDPGPVPSSTFAIPRAYFKTV